MKCPRVFFDTNVIIAAFAAPGLCRELVYNARFKRIEGIVSTFLLKESRRIFQRKLKLNTSEIEENIRILLNAFQVIESGDLHVKARGTCPFDPTDERVVSDALESGAHLLVTGDKELLSVKRVGACELLSPRQLVMHLK